MMNEKHFHDDSTTEQEDVQTQFDLGIGYYEGDDYDQEAIDWLLEEAMQGHPETQFKLAIAYNRQNLYSQAVDWWCKAAIQGHAQALSWLGEAYYYGRGLTLNYAHALECYQQAAEQGNDDAAHKLDENHDEIKRLITTKTYKKAVILSKLANQENVKAQYQLALMFNSGDGVSQNAIRAIELWREAARLGHHQSQYRLWHQAAEQGDIEAQYRLGSAYYEGWGIEEKNEEQAIESWHQAAEQGHTIAQYNLGVVYSQAANYEQALHWLHKVAERREGDKNPLVVSAQYLLGIMYKNGQGCPRNYQQAKEWLKRASHAEIEAVKYVSSKDFLKVVLNEKNIQEELITIVRTSAQEALIDIAKLEEQEKANQKLKQINQELKEAQQELKGIMAMFAHKFRGPLQSIKYNAEHENQQKFTLRAAQTMGGLLNTFSVIAMDSQELRKKLQQDMQGDGTLASVLEKALLLVLSQLLTIYSAKRIRQHYLYYAKTTGQVPSSTTREQWEEDYDLEEQLQVAWEDSFSALLTEPGLDKQVAWLAERFFPLEVSGFNDDVIHFEHYGTTESVLLTVMTEILLNAVKYYSSETNKPVKISWQRDKDVCRFICENPSHRKERRIDKGSKKGQNFLSLIARNLQGQFPQPLPKDAYWVELHLPTDLFVKEKI